MGIVKIVEINKFPAQKLGIWEFNEDSNALVKNFQFTNIEKQQYLSITNEKRKCEYLAVRLLLQVMMQKKMVLYYNSFGKPFLDGSQHISISHSSQLIVILLSAIPVGIDVESVTRNTEKVASRFLSEEEQQHINTTTNPACTRILYWCAKEALFKCTPFNDIEFKSQILIHPFIPSQGSGIFYGMLLKNEKHTHFVFHYLTVHENAVVFCMEQNKNCIKTN